MRKICKGGGFTPIFVFVVCVVVIFVDGKLDNIVDMVKWSCCSSHFFFSKIRRFFFIFDHHTGTKGKLATLFGIFFD